MSSCSHSHKGISKFAVGETDDGSGTTRCGVDWRHSQLDRGCGNRIIEFVSTEGSGIELAMHFLFVFLRRITRICFESGNGESR